MHGAQCTMHSMSIVKARARDVPNRANERTNEPKQESAFSANIKWPQQACECKSDAIHLSPIVCLMCAVCRVRCSVLDVMLHDTRHTANGAITAYSNESPSYSFKLLSTLSWAKCGNLMFHCSQSNHNIFLVTTIQCLRIQRLCEHTIRSVCYKRFTDINVSSGVSRCKNKILVDFSRFARDRACYTAVDSGVM